MTFNRKRVVALIDYKTGNVYPSAATQLAAYSDIVQQNTDYTIDMLFNWQPSDWTKDTNIQANKPNGRLPGRDEKLGIQTG